jgi:D-alanine-D-alanine ligase-like ATP-grasp enzyme
MQTKAKKRIGVLRGGSGKHYATSLKKGGEIIDLIFRKLEDKYRPIDILIDKDHVWHYNGLPVAPSDLVNKIDIAWNTTYPSLSNILDSLSIPNIKIGSFFHTLENNTDMLREHIKGLDLDMPRSILLPVYQDDFDGPREKYSFKKAKEIFEKFSSPWIVKSFTEDSNMGIHLAKTFPELVSAIEDGVKHKKSVLVEEFIAGKVASVHSVPGFRIGDLPAQAGEIYTFPLGNAFGAFSFGEKEKLFNLAKSLHKHIGAKHYLKSDFVLTPKGKIYLLQIDGTPDLKKDSHFSQVCESVGTNAHDVVEHILERAFI